MDAFLDPNIAYLLLAGGMMLAAMALVIPGTGLLELGAAFVLAFAGWQAFNLPLNLWALAALAAGIYPFWLAVRRSGKAIYLLIAILAFVIGSTYLFRGEPAWAPAVNPLLALVVSITCGVYLWIAVRKGLEAEAMRPAHDLQSLIGAEGETRSEVLEEGTVQVNGELWSARSHAYIPAGRRVRVTRRKGMVLEIEEAV